MTNDALLVLKCIFQVIWRLFTTWYIPGTNVTPAVAGVGCLFAAVCFRVFGRMFGLWLGAEARDASSNDRGDEK